MSPVWLAGMCQATGLGDMASKTGHKTQGLAGPWWHTPLIVTVRKQRQEDFCELEASLVVYRVNYRTARATQ